MVPHLVHVSGEREYGLGRLIPSQGYKSRLPGLKRADLPKLDVRTLPDFEYEPGIIKILMQGGYGACNGHAAITGMEMARHVAGLPYLALSPWYVYAILCNGVDRGSLISDALTQLVEDGTPEFDAVPWGTIDPRAISAEARAEAKKNRIEASVANGLTFDELCILAALRWPFNFSIRVARGFDKLDADGVVGFSRGAGNHAVAGGAGLKTRKNGDKAIKFANSWDTDWGLDGFGWFGREHWEKQTYKEAYGIKAVAYNPDDELGPVAA